MDTLMSASVFVVSEWIAKKNHEEELWDRFKKLMTLTRENEEGCVRAHATKQIAHPGSPGKSKYQIILLQEYKNIEAFNTHCEASYVTNFFKNYIDHPETGIVEEWTCRLFSEAD